MRRAHFARNSDRVFDSSVVRLEFFVGDWPVSHCGSGNCATFRELVEINRPKAPVVAGEMKRGSTNHARVLHIGPPFCLVLRCLAICLR